MGLNMTPQEVKVFLAEQKVCRMATVLTNPECHMLFQCGM